MASSILDRFCQKVAQIIRTRGVACFVVGAADNRLHAQALVSPSGSLPAQSLGHIEVDGGTPFSVAVVSALESDEAVVLHDQVAMAEVSARPPVMVVPIIWEREPLESGEQTVKRPVGILALWDKRGSDQFDEDDRNLARALSRQAAALLVEEQLEEFEDIQAAFATVPVGLVLLDREHRVLVANAAAMRVLQRQRLQGRTAEELDHRGQLGKLLQEVAKNGQGQSNGSFVARDGDTYSTSVQLTQEGQAIVAFTQSPFTTAAEELVGQVAHELRTPLTVIQGNLQTVESMLGPEMTEDDQEIIKEFISAALIQSARMFRLIAETLNISRIHAGKEIELELEEFNLVEALDQILAELDDRLVRFNVVREAPELMMVEGDRGKIVSILDNYLKNAAKYANPGTTITIRMKDMGDEVAMEVQDQGIGIPVEAIARIGREAGFRTDISKKQAGGIGLGMVYTRRVTEAHGGRMEIESEVGKGSTFRSILPKRQHRR